MLVELKFDVNCTKCSHDSLIETLNPVLDCDSVFGIGNTGSISFWTDKSIKIEEISNLCECCTIHNSKSWRLK